MLAYQITDYFFALHSVPVEKAKSMGSAPVKPYAESAKIIKLIQNKFNDKLNKIIAKSL